MNVNDQSKFSLGQYGSVSLDSTEQLSLLGSGKYLIGAIHILSNRESSAVDNSFQYLIAEDSSPLFWGTHYGGKYVFQFDATHVDATANTIKLNHNFDWKYLRTGQSFNYWKRGQSDSTGTGMTSYAIGNTNAPHTAQDYFIINKNEQNGTIQLATTATGSAVSLTVPDTQAGTKRALTFPAIVAQTTALIEDAIDGDDQNHDAAVFAAGDNIVEGVILYGRWNFVRLGAYVRAVAYLIPKMI
mgnify:CR=1 FL=1|tara:strand:+ start:448 stop:1176 length:729 start_codon:yes stop_codon:yes gene_type:complete